jgi:hypothetical protein
MKRRLSPRCLSNGCRGSCALHPRTSGAWVAAHPYKTLGYEDLPARTEDRNAALTLAVTKLREASARNAQLMALPEMRAQLAESRRKSQADTMYCWK